MGGYGSGRPKRHYRTDECLQIDMSMFKEYLREPGRVVFHLSVSSSSDREPVSYNLLEQPGLTLMAQCYAGAKELAGVPYPVEGMLTLIYAVGRSGKEEGYCVEIPLATTPCHFGRVRWWLLAPCCGRRVRILYQTPGRQHVPCCRACHELHYGSQCSSFVEKHITYEKYLLANYGYFWASDRYHSLKQRYFQVTPEWEEKKRRSELERELELLKHFIRVERMILKTYVRQYLSLRSEEDRACYLEFLNKQDRRDLASTLAKLFVEGIAIERIARTSTPLKQNDLMDQLAEGQLTLLEGRKKEVEEELEALAA